MTKVLLTDGRQRSTLAVTRSLGRAGVRVTVGEDSFPCLAGESKYCADQFLYPSPAKSPDDFVTALHDYLKAHQCDIIIPMTDITAFLLARHRDELSAYCRIPIVDWETFRLSTEKGELVALCEKIGVPVPKTRFFDTLEQVTDGAKSLHYPVVVKPRRSRFLTPAGWVNTSVGYARSPEELINRMKANPPGLPLPLVQERISGPGEGVFLLFNHGEERAIFFHRRIREKPPSGGVSVLRESIPVDPVMHQHAVRLLKALNWHGVAMVEFKIDRKDRTPFVMEINPRFWGSLQLAIDAGVDFPRLLHDMTINGDVSPVTDYKHGIRSRWLAGDLDHLLIRLLKARKKLNLPPDAPGRLKTLLDFLTPGGRQTRLEIEAGDDMGPARFEWKEYLRRR